VLRAISLTLVLTAAACGGGGAPGDQNAYGTSAPFATRTSGGIATATPPASPSPAPQGSTATVELEKGGSFTIQLRADKAPNTVANFIKKANAGDFDGTTFHRVVPGFVAQGGDPLSKTDPQRAGTGGGKQPTELSDLPFLKGSVGVARGGDIKVSNDAQWFVCLDAAPHLNGAYTNFGTVTSGMDVVLGIRVGDKIKSVRAS
jgi:peptidyl-prolyl cis-trans isomerase B (cyclophilin B)